MSASPPSPLRFRAVPRESTPTGGRAGCRRPHTPRPLPLKQRRSTDGMHTKHTPSVSPSPFAGSGHARAQRFGAFFTIYSDRSVSSELPVSPWRKKFNAWQSNLDEQSSRLTMLSAQAEQTRLSILEQRGGTSRSVDGCERVRLPLTIGPVSIIMLCACALPLAVIPVLQALWERVGCEDDRALHTKRRHHERPVSSTGCEGRLGRSRSPSGEPARLRWLRQAHARA